MGHERKEREGRKELESKKRETEIGGGNGGSAWRMEKR